MVFKDSQRLFFKIADLIVGSGPQSAVLAKGQRPQGISIGDGESPPRLPVKNMELVPADKKPSQFILRDNPLVAVDTEIAGGEILYKRKASGPVLPRAKQDPAVKRQGHQQGDSAQSIGEGSHSIAIPVPYFRSSRQFTIPPFFRCSACLNTSARST